MARKRGAPPRNFRLTEGAQKKLNTYLAEIRRGILNVCALHTYDSNPSLGEGEFEEIYIDKTLGMTASAVRLSIKSMTEGLAAQKQRELQALSQGVTPKDKKEE